MIEHLHDEIMLTHTYLLLEYENFLHFNCLTNKKIFFPPGKYSFQFKTILENWEIKINLSSYEEEKMEEI